MAVPVEMPQLGNTVEECILTRWVRRDLDVVSAGDVVAEIETDKTTFEVTAPVGGTVLATFFEEGALVPVFTNLFVIGNPGENAEAFRPAAARRAVEADAPPESIPGAVIGPGSVGDEPVPRFSRAGGFSPRAARFAATHSFDPAAIVGSGPGGRVLEQDVRRALEAGSSARTPALRIPHAPDLASPRTRDAAPPPTPPLRATIARRMRESLASTAQYTLNSSAAATGLLALRARIKSMAANGVPDVTINDLVAFCTVQALLEAPDLNAEFIDGRIVRHSEIHLAFAVDTPKGLLAPVVRSAQNLGAADLAGRMKELTIRAIQGRIAPDDLSGATFTISNLGSLGVESFTPLINPPQVAILGLGAIQPRAVRAAGPREPIRLRETSARRALALAGAVELVDSIGLSLTCDHQVIDGAPGARFLQVLRKKIEEVESLCDR